MLFPDFYIDNLYLLLLSLVTFLYVKRISRAGSNKFFCHFIYFLNSQRVFLVAITFKLVCKVIHFIYITM